MKKKYDVAGTLPNHLLQKAYDEVREKYKQMNIELPESKLQIEDENPDTTINDLIRSIPLRVTVRRSHQRRR